MDSWISAIIIAAAFLVIIVFFSLVPLRLYIAARATGVNIKIKTLMGMKLRKTPANIIVFAFVKASMAGIDITPDMLEMHYLAGGDVNNVVDGLIIASKNGVPLVFKTASALDLVGGNIVQFLEQLTSQNKSYTENDVDEMLKTYVKNLNQDELAIS